MHLCQKEGGQSSKQKYFSVPPLKCKRAGIAQSVKLAKGWKTERSEFEF
jgi:hypothetical protein